MKEKIKILAIGAHADECQIGLGGTLHLLHLAGCDCTILHVANHNHSHDAEQLAIFDREMTKSCEMLGAKEDVIGDRGNRL